MAARKRTTRRKTSTRRKPTTRRRTTRRTTSTTRRRRTRRKKNPSWDFMGTGVALVGGAAAGAAAYAADGVDYLADPTYKALALGAGGALLGMLVGGWSKSAGYAIAGGGAALATKIMLDTKMSGDQLSAVPGYARARTMAGGYPVSYPQMGAVEAQLNAITGDLGAVSADLGTIEALMS